MTIKQDLQALHKDIKALGKKMEKLIAAVEKGEKPKSRRNPQQNPSRRKPPKRFQLKKHL